MNSKKCYVKKYQEVSTSLKLFIPILISLLFYNKITSGEFFSREDKDPRLGLTTIGFKCYIAVLKQVIAHKLCCCWTKLRRKGLISIFRIFFIKSTSYETGLAIKDSLMMFMIINLCLHILHYERCQKVSD